VPIALPVRMANIRIAHQRRFERAPANSALLSIAGILVSRSKGARGSNRANGAMTALLSDRRRWGINAGASLGHQRRGIAGASAKIRILAGRATIAARRSPAVPVDRAANCGRTRTLRQRRLSLGGRSTPRLSAAADAAAPAAWRSSPPCAAPRRASADLVAERCDAAICRNRGEAEVRGLRPKPR
jgi:hypothetical protein